MGEIYYFNGRVRIMNAVVTTVSIQDVAKSFLSRENMTHKKLQKMCYYAYSWYYTLYGEKLFNSKFEAWIHGPVNPELYNQYKRFGWQDIHLDESLPGSNIENTEIISFLDQIYESYGHLDGDELEYLTHTEDPWRVARNGLPDYAPCNIQIEDDIIASFYARTLEDEQRD